MFGPRGAAHTAAIHSTLYIAHMVEKMAKIAKISKGVELLGDDVRSVEGRQWWWSPGAQCAHIGVLSRSISRAGAEGGHLHARTAAWLPSFICHASN